MEVNFIAQPHEQLGALFRIAIEPLKCPTRVTIVSAFASLQAILRLKQCLLELQAGTTSVRIVVGVDMGGTSKEVLQELVTWPVEVFVFKNRKSGITFHPKLYIVESNSTVEIFLGSNNLTDGGLYGNYEGAVRVTYVLPTDVAEFGKAKQQLSKFIDPAEPIGRRLTAAYLEMLVARSDIPSEAESRQRRKTARGSSDGTATNPDVFGFEPTSGPPKLPLDIQQVVLAAVSHQQDKQKSEHTKANRQRNAAVKKAMAEAVANRTQPILPAPLPEVDIRSFVPIAQISPTAFYLELVTTSGQGNIPGEQRIPLVALNAAQEFWGWPDKYTETVNARKGLNAPGKRRVKIGRKPLWRIRSIADNTKDVTMGVHMYYLAANSDYRFHAGILKKWDAKAGDIVRITRCDNEPYEYDCVLAIAGSSEHAEWKSYCSTGSERSKRIFGFS